MFIFKYKALVSKCEYQKTFKYTYLEYNTICFHYIFAYY